MSKRIWQHPEVPAGETTIAWRSPGQLADTAEFREWLEREFPRGAAEFDADGDDGLGRRSFLKLMGASTALAGFGLASCRRPEQTILPYSQAPEWVIPGKPTYYATSMPRPAGATPLVVTTFAGRPTLLAPNRLHPDSAGTDQFAQAAVLDLYSPSRSRTVLKGGQPSTRAEFEAALAALAKPDRKPAFVFGCDDSPTRNRLRAELAKKFPGAKFYAYEPLDGAGRRAALAELAGPGTEAVADFTKADRIVALDCDFAMLDPQGPVTPFFRRRKPEGEQYSNKPDAGAMNRLYVVESSYSLTGGMADHRLRSAPSQVLKVAAALVRQVATLTGKAIGPLVSDVALTGDDRIDKWVRACAADLAAHQGRALVLAGSRQPEAVHRLALALNAALDSLGPDKPLRLLATGRAGLGGMAGLHADLTSGAVDTLFLLTPANPVHDAPADLRFAESLARDGLVSVHLGLRADATAHAATWHVPAAHFLESWADSLSSTGVHSIVQPMILPLYPECVSEVELLLALLDGAGKLATGEGAAGAPAAALAAVRGTFDAAAGADEAAWRKALRDGFVAGRTYPPAGEPEFDHEKAKPVIAAAAAVPAPSAGSYEVVFAADASVWDGRWIDNGWLQEAPDPVSKLTWDNAALVSPNTAKELGVYDRIVELEPVTDIFGLKVKNAPRPPDNEGSKHRGPMIRVVVNGAELELPVVIAFGQADGVITIPLGYGQGFDADDDLGRGIGNQSARFVGQVGVNTGFNAYPLRTSQTPYFAPGAKVTPGEGRYPLALTQEHHSMYGRALAREVSTIDSADGKGGFDQQLAHVAKQGMDAHAPPNISLYKPFHADGRPFLHDELHQWAMAIDLSACMGCSACLVACQAENNIPIVGKQQVAIGREMHWIRMDRYFAAQQDGDPDNPALVPQPVACVQCESAPCEAVCPVNATVHTEDGLNAMAYNRCIGTRYCANNCPYKARRFNYFDYNKRNPLIEKNLYQGPAGSTKVGEAPHLQRNPNVTVRMRGIMEKCTYCVQRLKDAKIRQKRGHRQAVAEQGLPSYQVAATTAELRVPVDSVRTACQDACPAEAISFGNLLDDQGKGSAADGRVVVARRLDRNYSLLNYVGTIPRTTYLARVKNPNPDMPDARHVGKATIHMV